MTFCHILTLNFSVLVWRHHREGRGLQPHDLQESGVQGGLLLGVPGAMGAPRVLMVQLQQVFMTSNV